MRAKDYPIPVGIQFEINREAIASENPIRHAIKNRYADVLDVRVQHGMAFIAIGRTGDVKCDNYNISQRLFDWCIAHYHNPSQVEPIRIGVTYLRYGSGS